MTEHTPTPSAPQIHRPGAGRFVPKSEAPAEAGVVVQRNVLQPTRGTQKSLTSRHRRIAGNLPAWEPLPPDEFLIRRGV